MAKIKILSPREVATKPDGYHADGANHFYASEGIPEFGYFVIRKMGNRFL
jgi:hypothetical protein